MVKVTFELKRCQMLFYLFMMPEEMAEEILVNKTVLIWIIVHLLFLCCFYPRFLDVDNRLASDCMVHYSHLLSGFTFHKFLVLTVTD